MSAKNCSLAIDYDVAALEEIVSEEPLLIKVNSHYHLRADYLKVLTPREVVEIGGTITVSF